MNSKGFIATSILYGIVALLFACFMFVLANSKLVTVQNKQMADMVKNDIDKYGVYYKGYDISNVSETGFDVYLYGVKNSSGVANVQFGIIDNPLKNNSSISATTPDFIKNKISKYNEYTQKNWKGVSYFNYPSSPGTSISFNGTDAGNGLWYYHYNISDFCTGDDCNSKELYYNFKFVIFMTDANNKIFPITHFLYKYYPKCFNSSYANDNECKQQHNKKESFEYDRY